LDAIDKITEFIGEIDLTAYRADEKTKAAVERNVWGTVKQDLPNLRDIVQKILLSVASEQCGDDPPHTE